MSPLHDKRGSLQERQTAARVNQEIVRLGIEYNLCSRETSFVAVEKRETPVTEGMKLRRIPVTLTRDWGGLEQMALSMPVAGSVNLQPRAHPLLVLGPISSVLAKLKSYAAPPATSDAMDFEIRGAASLFSEKPSPASRPLDRLVALQKADGSWDLDSDLAAVLNRPLKALESSIGTASGDSDELRRAWATSLAIEWLHNEAAEWREEWSLLERKARQWLLACQAQPASGVKWLEAAATFLSKH